jgi:hypothetical protein
MIFLSKTEAVVYNCFPELLVGNEFAIDIHIICFSKMSHVFYLFGGKIILNR